MNSDSFWLEGPTPNLARLIARWDAEAMDILLLVAPTATSLGHEGAGDFVMQATGAWSGAASGRWRPSLRASRS